MNSKDKDKDEDEAADVYDSVVENQLRRSLTSLASQLSREAEAVGRALEAARPSSVTDLLKT